MERLLQIWKVNFRYHLLPHVFTAIILCCLAPFIMGVENLDHFQTAKILEIFLSLLGIIVFVPLFLPEQDKNIRDLITSKKNSMLVIYSIRFVEQLLILAGIIFAFLCYLKLGNCQFPLGSYYVGTLAGCIALGALGIFFYGITDNIAVGYMVPVLYYILCYGGGQKYMGKLYLFSMMQGNLTNKYYLIAAAIILLISGIAFRVVRK